MNKLLTNLGFVCIVIALGGLLGFCLVGAIYPRYLICKITDWQHPDGKQVPCKRIGADVAGNYADEPEPTATGIVYPTDTPEPEVTETPTVKETLTVPYPTIEATWTPNPYPSTNWLDWWRR